MKHEANFEACDVKFDLRYCVLPMGHAGPHDDDLDEGYANYLRKYPPTQSQSSLVVDDGPLRCKCAGSSGYDTVMTPPYEGARICRDCRGVMVGQQQQLPPCPRTDEPCGMCNDEGREQCANPPVREEAFVPNVLPEDGMTFRLNLPRTGKYIHRDRVFAPASTMSSETEHDVTSHVRDAVARIQTLESAMRCEVEFMHRNGYVPSSNFTATLKGER